MAFLEGKIIFLTLKSGLWSEIVMSLWTEKRIEYMRLLEMDYKKKNSFYTILLLVDMLLLSNNYLLYSRVDLVA